MKELRDTDAETVTALNWKYYANGIRNLALLIGMLVLINCTIESPGQIYLIKLVDS